VVFISFESVKMETIFMEIVSSIPKFSELVILIKFLNIKNLIEISS